ALQGHKALSEVVRRLRKKLKKSGSHQVVVHTLGVLDLLMANCGRGFQLAADDRKLMAVMKNVAKGLRSSDDLKKREGTMAFELIAKWADQYRGQDALAREIINAYEDLLKKDYTVSNGAAPRTASSSVIREQELLLAEAQQQQRRAQAASAAQQQQEQQELQAQLQSLESREVQLDLIANAAAMLTDMLLNVESKEEAVSGEVVVELLERCKTYQNSIAQMLSTVEDEGDMQRLLDTNESLVGVLNLHKHVAQHGPSEVQRDRSTSIPMPVLLPEDSVSGSVSAAAASEPPAPAPAEEFSIAVAVPVATNDNPFDQIVLDEPISARNKSWSELKAPVGSPAKERPVSMQAALPQRDAVDLFDPFKSLSLDPVS
ncbi:TOM1-like protein 3, partial [Durusdinium trenchii]